MFKKMLVITVALLMVIAFVATASAATQFKFSGKYRVRGFYDSNNDLSPHWSNGQLVPYVNLDGEATPFWQRAGYTNNPWLAPYVGKFFLIPSAGGILAAPISHVFGAAVAIDPVTGLPIAAIPGQGRFYKTEAQSYQDSYFDHNLEMQMDFIVSDALKLVIKLNALKEMMWGDARRQNNRSWQDADTSQSGGAPEFNQVYMEIKSAYGMFRLGRMTGGVTGLAVEGMADGNFSDPHAFGDSDTDTDRIWYMAPKMGPLQMWLVWDKYTEGNGRENPWGAYPATQWTNSLSPTTNLRQQSDLDFDVYTWLGRYGFENGGVNLTISYVRNNVNQLWSGALPLGQYSAPLPRAGYSAGFFGNATVLGRTAAYAGLTNAQRAAVLNSAHRYGKAASRYKDYYWIIQPAIRLNYPSWEINFEAGFQSGTRQYYSQDVGANQQINALIQGALPGSPSVPKLEDQDITGQRFYIDGRYKYGPGYIGVMYAYLGGDSDPDDNTIDGMASGKDFKPFYMVTGKYTDYTLRNTSNYSMIGVWADHSLTEDLMLHAAYGYINRLNTDKIFEGADGKLHAAADQGLYYGQEFDLGLKYKLMDNLSYEAHFGYFWAGDWYKMGSSYIEMGNSMHFDHGLTLSF